MSARLFASWTALTPLGVGIEELCLVGYQPSSTRDSAVPPLPPDHRSWSTRPLRNVLFAFWVRAESDEKRKKEKFLGSYCMRKVGLRGSWRVEKPVLGGNWEVWSRSIKTSLMPLPSFLNFPLFPLFLLHEYGNVPCSVSIVRRMPLILSFYFPKFGGWECEYTPEPSIRILEDSD